MTTRLRTLLRFRWSSPAAATRRPAAQARRKSAGLSLACGLLAFGLATATLVALLEEARPEWRDPEFGHRLKQIRHRRAETPGRPLVLVVGSSRTQMGVSPAAMGLPDGPTDPLVYNFGLMGATPVGIRFQLFRALDAGVRPDFVLAELFVANMAMGTPIERQRNWAHPERLSAADVGLLERDADDVETFRWRWRCARLTAWSSQRQALMANWLPDWILHLPAERFLWMEVDEFGFVPFPLEYLPPQSREQRQQHTYKTHRPAFLEFQVHARPERALGELVGRCKAEGIPVALFRTPESPWFRGCYTPQSRAAAEEFVASVSRSLQVTVFPSPDLAETDFADGHHLLPHAAAKYSHWLADTHVKPWLMASGAARR